LTAFERKTVAAWSASHRVLLCEHCTGSAAFENLDSIPLITRPDRRPSVFGLIAKRMFDLVVSTLVLIVFAPVFVVAAILIKRESKGPIFFVQQRIGRDGVPFDMIKFRTMHHHMSGDAPTPRSPYDPRITHIGRWLRRYSLDELPQFVNVLRGEMSVVGPRPERPFFVEQFRRTVPGYMLRHKVKSGVTGWAQVNGLRGNTSLEKRIQYDLEYIERWSLWLDVKIIVLTVVRIVFERNAY